MHLDQKVSLKTFHTFGMDVESRYFVEAKSREEILTLLNYRKMIRMPILFVGEGSNILFTGDFNGIVIRINSKGIEIKEEDEEQVVVTAEAGENWDTFVQYCVDHYWAGLENLSLIPGTVGAAPIQNIGAYGVEVKDFIESVHVVDIDSAVPRRLTCAECHFGYRDSIFKQGLSGKVIILAVTFRLLKAFRSADKRTSGQADKISPFHHFTISPFLKLDYGELLAELRHMDVIDPGIREVRAAVCNIRRRKLPDPAKIGNAGSFFKNPVIKKDHYNSLVEKFPGMPNFPFSPENKVSNEHPDVPVSSNDKEKDSALVKIPAAWLIDQCGWKGYREGDAGVHLNQPLVLVNYGNATGQQILNLANKIIDSVQQKFGINLELEVNVVGS